MLLLTATGAVGAAARQFSGWPWPWKGLADKGQMQEPTAFFEPEAADS
jgi:hypothetical protein